MSKSNLMETGFLALIFNDVAISLGTDVYVALHTAAPAESDTQDSNEATYTGYARVAVSRNATGWTVAGNKASPASPIEFGEATAGAETLTHFSIGVAATGATDILYIGTLNPSYAIAVGSVPRMKVTSSITEE